MMAALRPSLALPPLLLLALAATTPLASEPHTAAFVCNIAASDSVAVDLHWLSNGGQRKLKHTFSSSGERWKTRTLPGHQFAAYLRRPAATPEGSAAVPTGDRLLAKFTVGTESGHVHYIDELLVTEDEPPVAGTGAAAPAAAAPRWERQPEAAALTPAEASAVAAAAAEAELTRALPDRPSHIQPTADLPIPQIPQDGHGLRYIPGDEAKWRPDTERALLVAKQPGL